LYQNLLPHASRHPRKNAAHGVGTTPLLAGTPEEQNHIEFNHKFTLTPRLDFRNEPANFQKKTGHNYRRLRRWSGMVPLLLAR
jgi:hypothetical protein